MKQTQTKLISLTEAKQRLANNEEVLQYVRLGDARSRSLYALTSDDEPEAGNVYATFELPNKIILGDLLIEKDSDGNHVFMAGSGYDDYSSRITAEQTIELIKFLQEPYVNEEG